MHNFEAFLMLELNEFKIQRQMKRKKKYNNKTTPKKKKKKSKSNQNTIINKTKINSNIRGKRKKVQI